MGSKYHEIAFTPAVKALQEARGSRHSYARLEDGPVKNARLGARERAFIERRDSFYMATIGETGWPYMQHRGGPPGFVRVLGETTLGFPDFSGNRQFVSVGNLTKDDRTSLFFMDYANRARLKLFGRVRFDEDAAILDRLALPEYGATVERACLIEIEAFDWNCPQHITQRYSRDEVVAALTPLQARIDALEAQLAAAGETHS